MTLPTSGPLSLNDIQTEFGGANPIGINEYYAGGSLVPAGTSGTYGAVPSSGAISIQNFYGTASVVYKYVEDMFASYAYTGTGATQTITNGIDVINQYYYSNIFFKQRTATSDSYLVGAPDYFLSTNTTSSGATITNAVTAFTTSGFTLGSSTVTNGSGSSYISSTFVQTTTPKFQTVCQWTGNSNSQFPPDRYINHDLGSAPGFIFVRNNFNSADWYVWHQGAGSSTSASAFQLNSNVAPVYIGQLAMTSTQINIALIYNSSEYPPNLIGNSYNAYLFASNAGGFGPAGTDNIITCGRFNATTTAGSVSLGYEPQWLMVKRTNAASDWQIFDSARGFQVVSPRATGQNTYALNGTAAEVNTFTGITPSSTGFDYAVLGGPYLYVAVRKGKMKKPTAGTQVFSPITANNATGTVNTAGFAVDLQIAKPRASTDFFYWMDRLRTIATLTASPSDSARVIYSNNTNVEGSGTTIARAFTGNGFQTAGNFSSISTVYWNFKQAASFFDEVCYTGDGVDGRTVNHNLTVAPELLIVKARTSANWMVYTAPTGASRRMSLNLADADIASGGRWFSTTPTSTQFFLGANADVNGAATNFVAYLFASCSGVSKVGSFTGTGATQTINCGFSGGARFVMIKRIDSVGDWYVWDSVRGMVAGTNPSLLLNVAAAEVNANSVYTVSTGFQVVSTAAGINASGGNYLYLAIS